jgi:GNAT superfamily N-acetyltransferase
MAIETQIRQAAPQDAAAIADVLAEAAQWLQQAGMPLWRTDELSPASIAADLSTGLFFLAEDAGAPVGVVKFQLEDPIFWPDAPANDAAYIHRLAIRRRYAGTGLSTALLHWAVARAQEYGRSYLRLDCEASRPRLRAIYERFGFRYHSDKQVGPYHVARYEYGITKTASSS